MQVCKQGREMLEKVQGKKKKPDREARETCEVLHTHPHPVSPPKTLLTKLSKGSIHPLFPMVSRVAPLLLPEAQTRPSWCTSTSWLLSRSFPPGHTLGHSSEVTRVSPYPSSRDGFGQQNSSYCLSCPPAGTRTSCPLWEVECPRVLLGKARVGSC